MLLYLLLLCSYGLFVIVSDGQSDGRPRYKGTIDAFQTIYRSEGWRGLYKVGIRVSVLSVKIRFCFILKLNIKSDEQNVCVRFMAGTPNFDFDFDCVCLSVCLSACQYIYFSNLNYDTIANG